ncbi:flavonol sulfotransferase-like [Silene latifolia]|uniref:flavonol sulfotransferase-like n=1 Tax=Silene latifolia TaxID=37657 RepID=UPI003D77C272
MIRFSNWSSSSEKWDCWRSEKEVILTLTINKNKIQKEMSISKQQELEGINQGPPKSISSNKEHELINYQGFWTPGSLLAPILTFQSHFIARDTDLFITGLPKTGTTWLKSLLFTIVNRVIHSINQNPLLQNHPQELVYNLEGDIYGKAFAYPRPQHLGELPSPRLLSTHLPYASLPESIRTSNCRLLYICRNPFDALTSSFHFYTSFLKNSKIKKPPRFEDLFEKFCEGKHLYGPFFEHVLTYWKMSIEQPDKVLFLTYEDLKDDPSVHIRRVAEFVGMPFTPLEERQGVIDQIIEFCSIGNIKELEVNKSGVINKFFEKKSYFRKGEVGDWINHFTPAMTEKMTGLMEEKLRGTGLSFKLIP